MCSNLRRTNIDRGPARSMDEANFENAWTHPVPISIDRPNDQDRALVTGLCDLNWDIAGDGQVTTAAFEPRDGSDLSPDPTCPGYSVNGQGLAAHSGIGQLGANSALSLNTYSSSAFSTTTTLPASVVLPPEPQDHHTEYLCRPSPIHANLGALSGVKQLPATTRFSSTQSLGQTKQCTRCWALKKRVCLRVDCNMRQINVSIVRERTLWLGRFSLSPMH